MAMCSQNILCTYICCKVGLWKFTAQKLKGINSFPYSYDFRITNILRSCSGRLTERGCILLYSCVHSYVNHKCFLALCDLKVLQSWLDIRSSKNSTFGGPTEFLLNLFLLLQFLTKFSMVYALYVPWNGHGWSQYLSWSWYNLWWKYAYVLDSIPCDHVFTKKTLYPFIFPFCWWIFIKYSFSFLNNQFGSLHSLIFEKRVNFA
jgi:hypothetical protein